MSEIDGLSLSITADSKSATNAIKGIINDLSDVKSALKGFDTSKFSQMTSQLKQTQAAVEGLSAKLKALGGSKQAKIGLDTSGVSKSAKFITAQTASIRRELAGLQPIAQAAMNGDSSAMSSFERKAMSIKSAIAKVRSELSALGDTRIESAEFLGVKTALDEARKSLQEYKAQEKELVDSGTNLENNAVYDGIKANIDETIAKISELEAKMAEMKASGTDTIDPFEGVGDNLDGFESQLNGVIDAVHNAANATQDTPIEVNTEEAESSLDRLKAKLSEIGGYVIKNIGDNLKNSFTKIKDSIKGVSSGMDKFHGFMDKGFMKILRYGFGIRSLYVLFRRLRKAVVESFGELQKSGAFVAETKANIEGLKASLTTLKFQFGAAFQPIFNAIAPALQTLINYLVYAMNVLSAFTAKLMGKSTYSKAVASTGAIAGNMGSAAGSAKELNKQLQGFDELNNLTSNSPGGGGGGGGGGGAGSGAQYVTESVDSVLGDFGKELAEKIREGDWRGVGQAISDKLSEAMESIPWDKIYSKARNFGKNLAEFLNGLINPRLFANLTGTLAGALNTALHFLDNFGETFEWKNFGNSIAAGINNFFNTFDFKLLGHTVHTWINGILDAALELLTQTDFENIGSKIADFINELDIGMYAYKMNAVATSVVKAIADAIKGLWTNSDAQSKIGLALVGVIAAAKLTGLSAKLGAAISSYVAANPIVIGKLALVVGTAVVSFEGAKWVFEKIAEDFDEELAEAYGDFSWSDFWTTIMTPDGDSIDWTAIKKAWSDMCYDYYEPLFEEISSHKTEWIGLVAGGIQGVIFTGVETWAANLAGELIKAIKKAMSKVGDYLKTSWNTLLNGGGSTTGYNGMPSDVANNMFGSKGLADFGKDILDGIKKGFETALSNFDIIQKLWDKIVEGFETIFGIHSPAKKMYPYGADIFYGILKGFEQALKKSGDFVKKLWDMFWGNDGKGNKQSADFEITLSGVVDSIPGIDNLKSKYNLLKTAWQGRTSEFKTKMTGVIKSIDETLGLTEKFGNLRKGWEGASATFNAKVGEQITKITDLDTWKSKFNALKSKWSDDSATFSAQVGGQIKQIGELSKWTVSIGTLRAKWLGRKANYTFNANGTTTDTIDAYAKSIGDLYSAWQGRTAEFHIKASIDEGVIQAMVDKLETVARKVQDAMNKSPSNVGLQKSPGNYYREHFSAIGGIFTAQGVQRFANGGSPHGTMFLAGEAGPEIVGHVGGRTEVLNKSQLAVVMANAVKVGMASGFNNIEMSLNVPRTNYGSYTNSNGYANDNYAESMIRQNQLLEEQNRLLREIADKDPNIKVKDVFDATRKGATEYYNRTGNSPFLF